MPLRPYNTWPGPLHIFLHLALTAKTLDTPGIKKEVIDNKENLN